MSVCLEIDKLMICLRVLGLEHINIHSQIKTPYFFSLFFLRGDKYLYFESSELCSTFPSTLLLFLSFSFFEKIPNSFLLLPKRRTSNLFTHFVCYFIIQICSQIIKYVC